ncbi:MAG: hypothetical protein NTW85_14395 [Methylococcales bacterium]|nr:hypothetical protein [Methylococcales bacterium]
MQSLDVRTAFFICTGFIAIYGIGMMLFARNVSASFNGLYLFAMANFSLAIGFSLLFLMDYIDIFWSILVANTFILLGAILIYHAHLRFINYPNNPLLLSVFLLISTFCLHSFFLYINPNKFLTKSQRVFRAKPSANRVNHLFEFARGKGFEW